MTETKNILLIGGTGGGKSTLANVITNTNDFKEGKLGISETKEIQTKEFKNDNFDYLIIDNPGIGDTKLPTEKTLDTIAEAVYLVKNGVSRVFFVTDGRFDTNEMATYNLLRAVIFDKDVTKNTTIIRTRFKDFKKSKKREEDIKAMIDQGGELAEIIKSCEKRVIHVSNPSIEIEGADKEETELNKKARNKSREILLNHLSENCQTNSYKPPKLQALSDEIAGYMEGKKKLEEDLKSISKKKIRKLRNKKINDARVKGKDAKDSTENISKESEATAKQEKEQINDSQSSHSPDKKNNKVFKHIFNNYGDIEKVLGSDAIFISQGFNYRQTQEWARVLENNFNPEYDAGFCAWLRDNKQLTAEKTLHNNDVNIEQLKSEYHHQLQNSFIQECQLKASSYSEILEWIAYEDFSNIEYLAEEISKILGDRYNEMEDKSSKFYQQVQEAEEYNKTLPDEIKFPDYRAPPTYHSKHLPTKEITQLLKTLQLEDFKQVDLELEIPNEETEQQAQIQIPPK
ncbi:11463_t:CDS:2 [Gigaspora margarita]|uniref:11463_t:CDS:1 n=1 Tax=Gigaspora margarita TaxID=4874 RepID=A0ABN7VBL7_GIGMA|nr:11463_t:CDS:2 [Gigaspora margarita]